MYREIYLKLGIISLAPLMNIQLNQAFILLKSITNTQNPIIDISLK